MPRPKKYKNSRLRELEVEVYGATDRNRRRIPAQEHADEAHVQAVELKLLSDTFERISPTPVSVCGESVTLPREELTRTAKSLLDGMAQFNELAGLHRKGAESGKKRHPPDGDPPANSIAAVVALLRNELPETFEGKFTLFRAEATRKWLEQPPRKIYKSTDAVTKLVNRAKRRK